MTDFPDFSLPPEVQAGLAELRETFSKAQQQDASVYAWQQERNDQRDAALFRSAQAVDELEKMVAEMQRHSEELRRQADAEEQLNRQLEREATARAKSDKKYFWLGALVSLAVSVGIALLTRCLT